MAKWQFRKFKKFGPFRINFTKRGVSASTGIPGFRLSANSRGEVHRTIGGAGSGLYKREKISAAQSQRQSPGHKVELEVIDVTKGQGDLRDGEDPAVEALDIVELGKVGGAARLAELAGLSPEDPVTARRALLVPDGDKTQILLIVEPSENPSLFNRKETKAGTAKAFPAGRLSAKASRRLADLDPQRRQVVAVIYLDSRPGREQAEIRVLPAEFDYLLEDLARPVTNEPGPPAAEWYEDPAGKARLRYFDGTSWTEHTDGDPPDESSGETPTF